MIAEVGEISTQIRGISYNQGDAIQVFKEDYIPILRANNITEKGLNFEDLIYVPKKIIKEYQLLRKGDILIAASSGSKHIVGKAALVKSDICFSFGAFCKVIRPNRNIDFGYFSYFFQTPEYRQKISALSAGANINNLKNEHLNELKIPLPPLKTQKKIATILDKADELRQNDKKILEKYDQLAQSVFMEMFGDPVRNEKKWVLETLKSVSNQITDGTHDTPERITHGKKFITGKHIRPFKIDYENSDYVSEEDHKEIIKRCFPEYEDVLYTNIGVNLGTAAMNTVDYVFSMKNVALIKYKREILHGRFLESLLNTKNMKLEIIRMASLGGAQKFLSLAQIRGLEIPIPPLDLQVQFTKIIDRIEIQKALTELSLQRSEELFQSLLQRAFKGELV